MILSVHLPGIQFYFKIRFLSATLSVYLAGIQFYFKIRFLSEVFSLFILQVYEFYSGIYSSLCLPTDSFP